LKIETNEIVSAPKVHICSYFTLNVNNRCEKNTILRYVSSSPEIKVCYLIKVLLSRNYNSFIK